MKKFLTLFLILSLLLSLTACNKNEEPDYTIDADVTQFKVGVLFAGDPEAPYSSDTAHYAGIASAMKGFGMDLSTQLLMKTHLDRDETTVINAIEELIQQGANVIFGTDYTFFSAMNSSASNYPQVAFAHCGGGYSDCKNFAVYFGRMYQACYLSGIAAGVKSLELNNNTVGYISNFGTEYSENASAINAFSLGVQAVNPNAQFFVAYLDTWQDEASETAYAEDLIQSYGCGVIGQQCNSALPIQAAQAQSAFACGYATDMSEAAPKAHLTSAVWDWETFYLKAIKAAAESTEAEEFTDRLGTDNYYEGLKEGLVDIAPLSENCANGTKDAINKVKQLMVSGDWDVFSGVKLQISLKNGKATVKQYDDPLVDQLGDELVGAGEASISDEYIRSMSYFLISVLDA